MARTSPEPDRPIPHLPPTAPDAAPSPAAARIPRGAVLAGLGAAGVGLAATLAPGAPAHAAPPTELPVLRPGQDWEAVLAETPQVQLEPGARYVLEAPVALPDGALVRGNGALVTTSSRGHGAFEVEGVRDVTLQGLRLHGAEDSPLDVPLETAHTAIRARRATNLRISDCDLVGWRGAGIAATGSIEDDYFSYGLQISDCRFEACCIGLSAADRCEYSLLSTSMFTACRLAVWNSSGNWNLSGNVVVGCYGAYYSIAATSPFGSASSDNWGHGSITGCTLNHSDGGAPRHWTGELALPVGGELRDPGPGVVLEGVLPPTFSANTLWYTSVTARALPSTVWDLTGCTLSDLRITQDGGAPVRLIGLQSHAGASHAPVLVGDVHDALAP
ncbi:hypothetical protein ACT3SP_11935 [Brachybacterium sp. AOP43-C2-M15]|uniref:hypothetical protein n=1 Tax=Brachybacterium sp. AOP43-C2-M15 TaxID=3457661 RepID=UPI0040340492